MQTIPRLALVAALLTLFVGCDKAQENTKQPGGRLVWVRDIDGSNAQALSTAVDSQGNLLIATVHHGPADFGDGPLGDAQGLSLIVAKYNPAKAHLWSRAYPGTFSASTTVHLAVTPDDHLALVVGEASSLDLGQGALVGDVLTMLSGTGGAPTNSTSLESLQQAVTTADLAVDDNGHVLVVGSARALTDENGVPLAQPGPESAWFEKRDANDFGVRFSQHFLATNGTAQAHHLALTPDGELIATLKFTGSMPLGSGLDATLYPTETSFAVVRLRDDTGAVKWARQLLGPADAMPLEVACDLAADITLYGVFRDPADASADAEPAELVTERRRGVDGIKLWRNVQSAPDGTIHPGDVAVRADLEVVTAAAFVGLVPVDGHTLESSGTAFDLFVAKRDANDGGLAWLRLADGPGDVVPMSLHVDADGNTFASGIFKKTDNGGATRQEIFVLKLTP